MAESICRALRDGALQGELAPTLTIKDNINSPFGFHAFSHVLTQLSSNILAGKSQSRGLVLLSFSRSPAYYVQLLKKRGLNVGSSAKWIQILDCYTDPLGWKQRFMEGENVSNVDQEVSNLSHLCTNVGDMDKLFSSIITLGKGFVGEGTVRFCVAVDSGKDETLDTIVDETQTEIDKTATTIVDETQTEIDKTATTIVGISATVDAAVATTMEKLLH